MQGRFVSGFIGAGILFGASAQAAPVYFLAAERSPVVHGDSFVVPLENPEDVAHARDLILRGPEAAESPIIFAEIRRGVDGLNRDLLDPQQPTWSWHVTKFEGFGDVGIELLDSWPTYVEQNRDTWIQMTSGIPSNGPKATLGHIGFWNYTIVSELKNYPQAVPAISVIPLPSGLASGAVTIGLIGTAWMGRRVFARGKPRR